MEILMELAYFFERINTGPNSSSWNRVAKVTPSNAANSLQFGLTVAISGTISLIGANRENVAGPFSGAAYYYERQNSGTWTEVARVVPTDSGEEHQFGWSVAISNTLSIIGARYDDEFVELRGSAYFFERTNSGSWTEVKKVFASDAGGAQHFGNGVGISENKAIIGAPNIGSGAAYFFENAKSAEIPQLYNLEISDINSSGGLSSVDVFNGSTSTTVTFEYGFAEGNYSVISTSDLIFRPSSTTSIDILENGLESGNFYYFSARAENSVSFNYSTESSFWTLVEEPTQTTETFEQVGDAVNSIEFQFDSFIGFADGYLIIQSDTPISNILPEDGLSYNIGDEVGNPTVVDIIDDPSRTSSTISNLEKDRSYYFAIIPYNVGSNTATTNYYTDKLKTANISTIPTLGEWGIIIFSGLLLKFGIWKLKLT
jgi:hypothetical protein